MTDVLNIIRGFLKANGYDGLTRADDACRCSVGNLAPCGAVSIHCVPAYRWKCDGCPAPAEAKRLRVCGNCGNADWPELYPICLACDSEGSPNLQPWSSCAYSPSRWKERKP